MKQKLVAMYGSLLLVIGVLGVPLVATTQVGAVDFFDACSLKGNAKKGVCADKDRKSGKKGVKSYAENIINIALYAIGAVSTVVIIIGGVLYAISNGDPARVKLAKDAILYAVIGLGVALMSFAIVNFVVDKII